MGTARHEFVCTRIDADFPRARPHRRRALVRYGCADDDDSGDAIDWLRVVPFIAMHLACFGVIWVGVSPVALIVAGALYVLRMFAITAFYHRYFSHKAFKTLARGAVRVRRRSARAACSAGRCGGRRIIATIIAMRIPNRICIRRRITVSGAVMSAGS